MASSMKSNFHRTQSKVWWSNMNDHDPYRFLSLPEKNLVKNHYHHQQNHQYSDTVSDGCQRDYRRDSPGSLKSQDSGFDDSDQTINYKISSKNLSSNSDITSKNIANTQSPNKLTPKKNINNEINTQINQRSPSMSSEHSKPTPPTVIRKKLNTNVRCTTPRRISFSEPNSPDYSDHSRSPDLNNKIDSLNYSNTSPLNSNLSLNSINDGDDNRSPIFEYKFTRERSIKRGNRVTLPKRFNRRIFGRKSAEFQKNNDSIIVEESDKVNSDNLHCSSLSSHKPYNNETVYFGYGQNEGNNNNNLHNKSTKSQRLPTYDELFPNGTSTPKNYQQLNVSPVQKSISNKTKKLLTTTLDDVIDLTATMNWDTFTYIEYTNAALNGHGSSVQFWLDETRSSYCHEVLSTLQTKSLDQQSLIKNANICSITSGKIVRQLQWKAMQLQNHFEMVEKLIAANDTDISEKRIPSKVIVLFEMIMEFVNKIRKKNCFRAENENDLKKFDDNMNSISDLVIDLHKNVTHSLLADIELKELLEDILIVKRYLLITLQMIFEKLIKIIIDRIEETTCDLILRSNLTMISMLSNIEYKGFSSLNDAFRATGAIKVLLSICVDSKIPLIRALSLRALATVCSSKELIRQFEQAEGVEILKDILCDNYSGLFRSDAEYREAVSVLTQITASWHGRLHPIEGLRLNVENIVESLTNLLYRTLCSQTLLLCAACLNNLCKMEVTTGYSIMSNETLFKLKNACLKRHSQASIFLHEQISSILLNMAAIKKCHSHLAHKEIITFITDIFQIQFFGKYKAKAETEAQHHTIKNILHIFSRLIHESVVGQDVLENNVVPVFVKIENHPFIDGNTNYSKDISNIVKKLNESVFNRSFNAGKLNNYGQTKTTKVSEKKLLESYV